MSNKKLLILERSKSNLNMTKDADGSIVLEGVFTEIGVKNKNNRIYEEAEVLPHINELKEIDDIFNWRYDTPTNEPFDVENTLPGANS